MAASKIDTADIMSLVMQALSEARGAKIAVDALRAQASSSVVNTQSMSNFIQAVDTTEGEFVPLDFTAHNPSGSAPFAYDVFIEGSATPFIVAGWTGDAAASAPATKGVGRYVYSTPNTGTPTVLVANEQFGSSKDLETLIDEDVGGTAPNTWTTEWKELTFVLDSKIMTIKVLVQDYKETTGTGGTIKHSWAASTDQRKILQVMPDNLLGPDLGYLLAP
jgi:hypothetical protein